MLYHQFDYQKAPDPLDRIYSSLRNRLKGSSMTASKSHRSTNPEHLIRWMIFIIANLLFIFPSALGGLEPERPPGPDIGNCG